MTHAADSPAFAGVHNATIDQVGAATQQRRRAGDRRDRIRALIYPIGMMVVLIAVWQVAALLFSFPPYLLPAPSAVGQAMDVNAAVLIKHSAPRQDRGAYLSDRNDGGADRRLADGRNFVLVSTLSVAGAQRDRSGDAR